MSNKFHDNQSLKRLIFPNDELITVGTNGVTDIYITMENGQMAPVPWAIVLYKDGKIQKWNLAQVEGVNF
jgi:hypothetical protein